MVWFTTTPAMVILETVFCADHSRDTSRAGVSRHDSRARDFRNESRNEYEPSTYVDSRNGLCVEVDFQRDDEALLGVRKDDVTFLDVQTDGVTLPVPCSSSSSDMKLESDAGTDDSTSGLLAKSAEMKRLGGSLLLMVPHPCCVQGLEEAHANRGSSTEGT